MPTEVQTFSWPLQRANPLDPPAELAQVRSGNGIARIEMYDGTPAWLLTRYSDIRAVLRERTVSSDGSMPGFPMPSRAMEVQRSSPTRSFPRMDPPVHTKLRGMLQKYFTLGPAQELRPYIAKAVSGLLDAMQQHGGPLDLVSRFAQPLPAKVTCGLLGLADEDGDFLNDRTARWSRTDAPSAETAAVVDDLVSYFAGVIEHRRADPGQDLISMLLQHVDSQELPVTELQTMLMLLLIGGYETTANMIALSVIALLRHPEQLSDLRDDPTAWPGAIEELLRYLTVAHQEALRLATQDISIGGCPIRAGEGLVAPLMAANRDPEVFPEPDKLDIRRDARRHLAFGGGIHQCLGQSLARAELNCALPALFDRLPDLRVPDLNRLEFVESAVIYGVKRLDVTW